MRDTEPCGSRVALSGMHLFCTHCRVLQTESCAVSSFTPLFPLNRDYRDRLRRVGCPDDVCTEIML